MIFTMQKVLDMKFLHGKKYYLIEWLGYESESTRGTQLQVSWKMQRPKKSYKIFWSHISRQDLEEQHGNGGDQFNVMWR